MQHVDDPRAVTVVYTNHRGETAQRHILPLRLWYGTSEWHPDPQWLLDAVDLDRNVERSFALKDVHSWTAGSGVVGS